MQKLLIAEEDKLGSRYERLEDIDQEIAKADQRIELQRRLVASLEREGGDGIKARALLERLIQLQATYKQYRDTVQAAIE